MKLRKPFVIAASVVILLLGGAFVTQRELAARRAGKWVPVVRDDLVIGAEVSGQLESVDTAYLGPPQIPDSWEFKISMLVPEGTEVRAGTPVLAFDTDELQRELEQKTAEADGAAKEIEKQRASLSLGNEDEQLRLAESDGRLRKADLKLQRPDDILALNERKEIEIDRATSAGESSYRKRKLGDLSTSAREELRLLEAKRNNASSRVAQIRDSIEKLTVRAPRDGAVVYVPNWRGDKKKVGDPCWIGEKVLEIPDLGGLRARGEIDESDSGRVVLGQRATLRLDALPDDELHGTVIEIGRTVQRQQVTSNPLKVLVVKIAIDRVDREKMRPGMRFQGTLEMTRVKDAVLVPADALSRDGHTIFVTRRTLFTTGRVEVQPGRRNNERVEIVKGLAPGDRVLIPVEKKEESGGLS